MDDRHLSYITKGKKKKKNLHAQDEQVFSFANFVRLVGCQ